MKTKANILIIDDHSSVLNSLDFLLQFEFEKIITNRNPNAIHSILESQNIDVVLLDMNFSAGVNTGNEGLYWLKRILEWDPEMVVVLITAYGDVELAVKAIREGAFDFVLKPWDNQKLIGSLHAGLKLRRSKEDLKHAKHKEEHLNAEVEKKHHSIIGKSKAMNEVFRQIEKVARTDANVLITGENGTGKELVARELHRQSLRASQSLISVDMTSLPETLIESELFGQVKGAFTDAHQDKPGRFELAQGSSLFLDEIGNIPLNTQTKILTALEQRKIYRVGATQAIDLDIRLISATNKNLEEMSREGSFRTDLLYRINTIQIELPPLRKRVEDIPLLAIHYVKEYCKKYNKADLEIPDKLMDDLKKYNWPGNVRELRHSMEKAVILAEGNSIRLHDLGLANKKEEAVSLEKLSLEELEEKRILQALRDNDWHLNNTADELKIARQTLYRKLKKYGLEK